MATPVRPSRRVDLVRPGHYAIRLVRGGPQVAALVEVRPDGWVVCTVNGGAPEAIVREAELAELVETRLAAGEADRDPLLRILWYGQEITEARYRYLLQLGAWARQNAPEHPAANPHRPVNLGSIPVDLIVDPPEE